MIPQQENLIELRHISKSFDGVKVLDDINLAIHQREFLTLLGSSGCGKTTILRIIGGFESQDSGEVYFHGQEISDVPPNKRQLNTVFQKYALFPHLNVFENIAFGLRVKKLPSAEIKKRVTDMLELVNLSGFENRRVDLLSGGQQQRIAIARSLVNEPEMLLLDEPLGALDLKLRKEMQIELKNIQQKLNITFLYVTHDQEEALTMSDQIAVLRNGRILQIGEPKAIYDEPINAYVANFIGESNILRGTMIEDELVEFAGRRFKCVDKGWGSNVPVDVVVRPEDLVIGEEDRGQINGVVRSVIFKGIYYEMMVDCGTYVFKVQSTVMHPKDSRVSLSVIPFNIQIMKPDPELPELLKEEGGIAE